jgi:hypothetical protein
VIETFAWPGGDAATPSPAASGALEFAYGQRAEALTVSLQRGAVLARVVQAALATVAEALEEAQRDLDASTAAAAQVHDRLDQILVEQAAALDRARAGFVQCQAFGQVSGSRLGEPAPGGGDVAGAMLREWYRRGGGDITADDNTWGRYLMENYQFTYAAQRYLRGEAAELVVRYEELEGRRTQFSVGQVTVPGSDLSGGPGTGYDLLNGGVYQYEGQATVVPAPDNEHEVVVTMRMWNQYSATVDQSEVRVPGDPVELVARWNSTVTFRMSRLDQLPTDSGLARPVTGVTVQWIRRRLRAEHQAFRSYCDPFTTPTPESAPVSPNDTVGNASGDRARRPRA